MATSSRSGDTESRGRRLSEHSLRSASHCLTSGNYGRAFAHYLLSLKLTPDVKDTIKDNFTFTLREWAEELEHANRFQDLFNCYEQACELFPECETVLNNMGAQLFRLGFVDQAACCFRRALRIDPACLGAQDNFESVCSHLLEQWHFRMLNDTRRNTGFKVAISRAVESGHTAVLDIGAGEGLLSMLAADAGAKTIYACEMSKPIYEIACDVLEANQMRDKVNIVHKSSLDLVVGQDIPQRVSLIVTETVDAGLLGENILGTLHHAWEHLLLDEPGSKVIPAKATVYGCLIESLDIRRENKTMFPGLRGLDLSHVSVMCDTTLRDDQPYTTIDLKSLPAGYRQLSDVFTVAEFDFNNRMKVGQYQQESSTDMTVIVNKAGRVDAIVTWFDLHLDDRITLNTGPEMSSCWEQAVYPVLPCHLVQQGVKENFVVKVADKMAITVECQSDCLNLRCVDVVRNSHVANLSGTLKAADELGLCSMNIGDHDSIQDVKGLGSLTSCENALSATPSETHSCNGDAYTRDNCTAHVIDGTADEVYLNGLSCSLAKKEETPGMSMPASMELTNGHEISWSSSSNRFILDRSQIRKMNDIDYNCTMCSRIEALIEREVTNVLVCCHDFSPLGLQAASQGARSVLLTMDDESCQQLVHSLAKTNQIQPDSITFETDLRKCARLYDVMVVDLVEPCGIMGQQILEDIALARVFGLREHGVVVPGSATVYGVAIESTVLTEGNCLIGSKRTLGYNIAPFINDFQMRNHVDIVLSTLPHKRLSEPFKMLEFNFNEELDKDTVPAFLQQNNCVKTKAMDSGTLTAIAYWFELHVTDKCSVSTLDSASHFKQAAIMMKQAETVSKGQELQVEIICKNSNFYISLK